MELIVFAGVSLSFNSISLLRIQSSHAELSLSARAVGVDRLDSLGRKLLTPRVAESLAQTQWFASITLNCGEHSNSSLCMRPGPTLRDGHSVELLASMQFETMIGPLTVHNLDFEAAGAPSGVESIERPHPPVASR